MVRVVSVTKLKRLCRERDIATAQLARESGVSRKHLTGILDGKVQSPGITILVRVVDAYNRLAGADVAVDDLFSTRSTTRRKAS